MKQFVTTHFKYVIGIAVVLIVGGAAWYIFSNTEPTIGSYTISRGDVVSSVDIPGTVSSSDSVDLSFQEAGQIEKVYVKEGESVTLGEALVSLDDSSQQATLSQEKAALAAAEAKLEELQAGTRPEQLALYEQGYDSASTALVAAMNNAYLKIEDAIVNNTDKLFVNGDTVNPTLSVPDQSQNDQYATNDERVALKTALEDWKTALFSITSATSSLQDARTAASNYIAQAQSFLSHLGTIVGSLNTGNSGLSQTVINADTSLVNAASQEVTGAANAETAADAAWSSAADSLTLAQAGSQSQDIEAQRDVVLQAQAAIDNATIVMDHATIVAPFSGIVRNVVAKSGMVVSVNVPVISIISNKIMKFDAYASETDAPKLQENATTPVTLDAYGESVKFMAHVNAIDTSQTTINGSPAYHVTLYFTESDSRILAGMTGDVHVITGEHDNVVEVPDRLVLGGKDNSFVIVQNGGETVRIPVTLGIAGDDGMVEVVSGLDDGEKISDF